MKDNKLAEIRKRFERTQAWPWEGESLRLDGLEKDTAAFITHAYGDIGYLLEEVGRLRDNEIAKHMREEVRRLARM